jgi:hypothetical protein
LFSQPASVKNAVPKIDLSRVSLQKSQMSLRTYHETDKASGKMQFEPVAIDDSARMSNHDE